MQSQLDARSPCYERREAAEATKTLARVPRPPRRCGIVHGSMGYEAVTASIASDTFSELENFVARRDQSFWRGLRISCRSGTRGSASFNARTDLGRDA
jgi:hypothetical protein